VDPRARKITLRQFSETWLASQTFSEASREVTERRLRLHIWPVLGDKLLRQITPSVIHAWVRWMDAAPSSVQVRLTLLSPILGAAVDNGLVGKNQTRARSVKAPRAEQDGLSRGPQNVSPPSVTAWLSASGPWQTAGPGSGCTRAKCSA
jgi:hypothetical protein